MSKILVCYVTPFDATAQIAMTVAEQLCRRGYYVDLRAVRRVGSVRQYSGVMVGGALSDTDWDSGPVELLHRCLSQMQRSVWLYHTGFGSGPPRLGAPLPGDVLGPDFVAVLRDDDSPLVRRWATMIARQLDAARPAAQQDPPLAVAATASTVAPSWVAAGHGSATPQP